MKKQSLRISMIATPMMIVCGLLVSGASARAESEGRPCSNRTLKGDYGFTGEGLLLPSPGVTVPIRGVAMTHFDGQGKITQVDHVVVDGVAPTNPWSPSTGTYQVNANCTGTVQIVPGPGVFINQAIVVVRQGKEIRAVVTGPFVGPARAITSVGVKVE